MSKKQKSAPKVSRRRKPAHRQALERQLVATLLEIRSLDLVEYARLKRELLTAAKRAVAS